MPQATKSARRGTAPRPGTEADGPAAGAPEVPDISPAEGVADALHGTITALKRNLGDPEASARTFVLAQVARLAPVRATDLAEHVHLDGSTISRHLRGLEESGLLERSPDPDDRRASLLGLTDEGRAWLRSARSARTALFASATDRWTDDEVAMLTRLLRRLTHDLENL